MDTYGVIGTKNYFRFYSIRMHLYFLWIFFFLLNKIRVNLFSFGTNFIDHYIP